MIWAAAQLPQLDLPWVSLEGMMTRDHPFFTDHASVFFPETPRVHPSPLSPRCTPTLLLRALCFTIRDAMTGRVPSEGVHPATHRAQSAHRARLTELAHDEPF